MKSAPSNFFIFKVRATVKILKFLFGCFGHHFGKTVIEFEVSALEFLEL